jgi:hypothetical protein
MRTLTRILACFIFLMLGWSSVDTLPDPPAVKSRSVLDNAIAPLIDHVAVVRETTLTDALASRAGRQPFSVRLRQDFEVVQPSCSFFIRCATDASPPRGFEF